jgi:hypothetical protein
MTDFSSSQPDASATPYVPSEVEKCFDMKISLAQDACDCAAKQYDDYYKSFTAFDVKAQATATISGLVLASVVAFVNAGRFQALLIGGQLYSYLFVLLPPALALCAVIVSLVASRVREVKIPFDSIAQIREAEDLAKLGCEQFSKAHVLDYYLTRLNHWRVAVDSIAIEVDSKAKWVKRAQILMVSALLFLLVLFMVTLLTSPAAPTK